MVGDQFGKVRCNFTASALTLQLDLRNDGRRLEGVVLGEGQVDGPHTIGVGCRPGPAIELRRTACRRRARPRRSPMDLSRASNPSLIGGGRSGVVWYSGSVARD